MIRTAALLLASITAATQADIAAYSNFATLDDVSGAFFPTPQSPDRIGFTFQAQASGQITSIVLPIDINPSDHSIFFEIYAVNTDGVPADLIAAGNQTISGTFGDGPGPTLYSLTPLTNGSLQAGQNYALTLAINGSSGFRAWHTSNAAPEGLILSRTFGSDWITQPAADAGGLPGAQIFVVPTPAAITLLALATPVLTRRQRPR